VLVLLDGVPLNEPVLGGAGPVNLSLSADHIRQVELLRGPGSALFGQGALVGIISVTLQTLEDFTGTELLAGGGSFGTQDYAIRSGAGFKRLQISGFVRFQDSSGARLAVPADAQTVADQANAALGLPPISLAPGRTSGEYRTIETAYRFSQGDFHLGLRGRADTSGGFVGWADSLGRQNDLTSRQTSVDLGWKRDVAGVGALEARLSFTQNSNDRVLQIYPSGFRTNTASGEVQEFGEPGAQGGVFLETGIGSRRLAAEAVLTRDLWPHHQLTAGFGLGRESTHGLKANGSFDFRIGMPVDITASRTLGALVAAVSDSRRSVASFFVQDVYSPNDRFALTAGMRFDHYWGVGGTLSPRLALVGNFPSFLERKLPTALASGLSYKLLYGRSFRVPTLAELYFRLPGYTGNPDLEPVVADTVEAGLDYKGDAWRVAATGYWNLVGGTIETGQTFLPVGALTLRNGSGVRVFGFEAELRRTFGVAHSAFLNYAYQHARERDHSGPAPDVPAHLAKAGATLSFRGRWSVTPTVALRSSRPRAPGDARLPLDGAAIFGISARVREVYRGLGADLLLQNVFGAESFDPAPLLPGDYPLTGRRVLLHVSYRF
jgi:iron complex outermembrane receptor protein